MKHYSLLPLLLTVWTLASGQEAETPTATATSSPAATPQDTVRPILKTLSEKEALPYPNLGISITAPANTQLIGAHAAPEPENYLFPWLKTPLGRVEIAFASPISSSQQGTLEKMFAQAHQHLLKRGTMILPVGTSESKTIGTIPMIRQQYEGKWHFQIVRYYFVAPDGRLAFLHLCVTEDMNDLERLVTGKLISLNSQTQKLIK